MVPRTNPGLWVIQVQRSSSAYFKEAAFSGSGYSKTSSWQIPVCEGKNRKLDLNNRVYLCFECKLICVPTGTSRPAGSLSGRTPTTGEGSKYGL